MVCKLSSKLKQPLKNYESKVVGWDFYNRKSGLETY